MLRSLPAVRVVFLLLAACMVCGCATQRAEAPQSPRLHVLDGGYPHAFFFRSSEGFASNKRITYERWDAIFSRLMGIEGKVLDEEVPGRSARNIDFFSRFKLAHPRQLVLLHYNGRSRDPRYQTEKFFAGHWIYFSGAKILSDVPAEDGETEIRVDDAELFKVNIGRYQNSNEDVGLCDLDEHCRPNWRRSEQVQLLAVDAAKNTIRVRRGCFGTVPLAFAAGKSYAAAHCSEGPWGGRSNLLWYYNYSTRCPQDECGRTCVDVHAEELAARFLGGELKEFDGLEFDVLPHVLCARRRARGADCDADGKPDEGVFGSMNTYGTGVVNFCRKLRSRLGPDRLMLADGMSEHGQRAFGILNGIESEGWPTLSDWEARDWSGGLNRHWFWRATGHAPAFSYVNHKYCKPGDKPGGTVRPDVPFNIHRLVFAAAVFTDSAICYSYPPPADKEEGYGVWDELRMGKADRVGWLGRPIGPAVRMASRQPDVLGGLGSPVGAHLIRNLDGYGVRFNLSKTGLNLPPTDRGADHTRFCLRGVRCDGPDLFVSVTACAEPLGGHPPEIARLMRVGIAPPEGMLTLPRMPQTGLCLRGGREAELAPETGAGVRWWPSRQLGGQAHDCYFVHPPYKTGVGYAFWQRDVRIPDAAELCFFTGMGEKSPERSDGVLFRVLVTELADARPGEFQEVFGHTQKASEWIPHSVDLSRWAGKTVRLKFVSDCGPKDDSTTDHSYWGAARVRGPDTHDEYTEPVSYMTWVGRTEFTSGFYFSDVRTGRVDLEFIIEGSEPVTIRSPAAYAHPDAIYREFEKGIVLANPAPHAYVFDLDKLFPGKRFRRLTGSARQDPKTNDGSRVEGKLTLGAKDALFLARESTAAR